MNTCECKAVKFRPSLLLPPSQPHAYAFECLAYDVWHLFQKNYRQVFWPYILSDTSTGGTDCHHPCLTCGTQWQAINGQANIRITRAQVQSNRSLFGSLSCLERAWWMKRARVFTSSRVAFATPQSRMVIVAFAFSMTAKTCARASIDTLSSAAKLHHVSVCRVNPQDTCNMVYAHPWLYPTNKQHLVPRLAQGGSISWAVAAVQGILLIGDQLLSLKQLRQRLTSKRYPAQAVPPNTIQSQQPSHSASCIILQTFINIARLLSVIRLCQLFKQTILSAQLWAHTSAVPKSTEHWGGLSVPWWPSSICASPPVV